MIDIWEDTLAHHGILGQKWGVRNSESDAREGKPQKQPDELVFSKKLKSGATLNITKDQDGRLAKFMQARFPNLGDADITEIHRFTLRDVNNKSIGQASFCSMKSKPGALYLDWVTIGQKNRGQGYATATMKGMVKYAQDKGIKKLVLEVPGNAPDAEHIYSKLGFKTTGKMVGQKDDYWGGLTEMELEVPQTQLTHSDSAFDPKEFAQYISDAIDEANLDDQGNYSIAHSKGGVMPDVKDGDYLAHYGVNGMHWGQHLPGRTEDSHNPEPHKVVKEPADDHVKAHALEKKSVSQLSNSELQQLNQRLQLEQNYSKLKSTKEPLAKIKKGHDYVKTAVGVAGTGVAAYGLVKSASIFLKSPEGQKAVATGARTLGKLIGKW